MPGLPVPHSIVCRQAARSLGRLRRRTFRRRGGVLCLRLVRHPIGRSSPCPVVISDGRKHSTPTSILALIYPSLPPLYRSPQARFSWRHYYVDATPRSLYKYRDLITFSGRDFLSTKAGHDAEEPGRKMDLDTELDDSAPPKTHGRKVEDKTLSRYGYEVGDIISVSVSAPEPRAGGLGLAVAGAVGNGVKSFGWGEGSGAGTNTPKDGRSHDHGWGARGGAPDVRRGAFAGRGDRDGGPRDGRFGRDSRDARDGRDAEGAPGGSWRGGRGGGFGGGAGRSARSRSPGPRGDRPLGPERSPVRDVRDRRGDDRYDDRREERRESWSRR